MNFLYTLKSRRKIQNSLVDLFLQEELDSHEVTSNGIREMKIMIIFV